MNILIKIFIDVYQKRYQNLTIHQMIMLKLNIL